MPALLFAWRAAFEEAAELSATDKHVLWSISRPMDEHGRASWPSVTTLARRTSRKRHTVIESVAWAEASGWLNVDRRRSRGSEGVRLESHFSATIPTERKTKAVRAVWA